MLVKVGFGVVHTSSVREYRRRMEYLLWLGFSILCGVIGSSKGRNGFLVFLAAVFLTPILTLIYILVVPKQTDAPAPAATETEMACPQCAEAIKRAAKVCRFCGYDLEAYKAEQEKNRGSDEWIEQRFERWLREQNPPVINPHPDGRAELKKSFLWRLKQGEIVD